MTLDLDIKLPYLKTFNEIIYKKGWTFTKSAYFLMWTFIAGHLFSCARIFVCFHAIANLLNDKWTRFIGGPNEKDRQLLVEFDVVIDAFLKLKPAYQSIIADIRYVWNLRKLDCRL